MKTAIGYSAKRVGMMLLGALLTLSSCIRNDVAEDLPSRTVLVYIAADNNLVTNANPNIYSMSSAMGSGMGHLNLLAFVDRHGAVPVMLRIHDHKIDTLNTYPELNSADASTLAEAIDFVRSNYKSDSYGLIMWSHGTGWLPTKQLHNVAARSMGYVQGRDGGHNPAPNDDMFGLFDRTKSFAWEARSNQRPNYTCMELDEMAEAIPDGMFDFIAFDACYMGNIEIAYALRRKTDYFISSCYEIMSYGYPYHDVTKDFMNGDLKQLCQKFYNYYNSMSISEQMAGISLVKTSELDSVASCFRKIVADFHDSISHMDVSQVQCFDRFDRHVFYDLRDFVEKLGPRKEYVNEFNAILDKCIPYKISTPYIFPGGKKYWPVDAIDVNEYCGLSVYVPLSEYDSIGLNDDYRRTAWSIATEY